LTVIYACSAPCMILPYLDTRETDFLDLVFRTKM